MKKWILSLVVLFAVGFVSYKAGQRSAPAAQSAEQIEDQVKAELIELTRKDFEEYQSLKTLEDRYKKADEILGKIVTIFLADLGLRLGYHPTNPALLDAACAIAAPTPIPSVTPTPEPTPQMMSQETPKPTPTPAPRAWTRGESRVYGSHDEFEALAELRKLEIPDLFSTLKDSKSLNNREAMDIDGRFQGEISFFDRKTHKTDWYIEWEVQYQSATKDGRSFIALTRKSDGKTFSRTRSGTGKGLVTDNFMRPVGSKALIVNVYGDDGYIQIYPLGNKNTWVGNYYEKAKLGEYKMVGQVKLNKME